MSAAVSASGVRPDHISGNGASDTVTTSDEMLKKMRCSGLRLEAEMVDCAHALTAAMQIASAAGMANSAQKFTACDSERFDRLRPSGSSISAAQAAGPHGPR